MELFGVGAAGIMEIKFAELNSHVSDIRVILQEICEISDPVPLVTAQDLVISAVGSTPIARPVTTDLGEIEVALRLPIPDAGQARFWIGLHERWAWYRKYKIRFRDCALRLYAGAIDEEALQLLRLEWVAPEYKDGEPIYQGRHAGHPHWHIDRAALVGPEEYIHSLEVLTLPSPSPQPSLELFNSETSESGLSEPRPLQDCSWLQKIHLPAESRWMKTEWDGHEIPGPHQTEPENLKELSHWWAGALRYLTSELRR